MKMSWKLILNTLSVFLLSLLLPACSAVHKKDVTYQAKLQTFSTLLFFGKPKNGLDGTNLEWEKRGAPRVDNCILPSFSSTKKPV